MGRQEKTTLFKPMTIKYNHNKIIKKHKYNCLIKKYQIKTRQKSAYEFYTVT